MALRDVILKQSGGLQTTSQEEATKLAERAGRTAAPIAPLETSVIGGNKDQAKMAGTPNQRLNALRQSVAQSMDYSTQERRETTQATTGQREQREVMQAQLEALEGLGNLSNRVKQIALNRFTQQYAEPTQLELADDQLASLPTDVVNRIQSGSATQADMLAAADSLGLTTSDVGQLGAQLMERLGVSEDVKARWLAGLAEGQLTLGEFEPTELGYQDINELADALGLTPEEASALSLEGLNDLLDRKQQEQFDQVRDLRRVLTDPASTPAQREAARAQLGQLQAAGVDDVEVQYGNLERAINEGQTIQFDGQQINVAELLDSDGLELRIAQALSSEEELARLKESEPELGQFIEDNRAAFEALVQDVDEDAQAFATLQQENQALAKPTEELPEFGSDVMSSWYEDWGQLRSEAYEPNGVLQILKDPEMDAGAKEVLHEAVNSLSKLGYEEDLQYLGSLSPKQITALGLTDGRKVDNYIDAREQTKYLEGLEGAEFVEQSLGMQLDDLNKQLEDAAALNASGIKRVSNPLYLSVLDRNKDGKLDSWRTVKSRLLQSGTSLKDLVSKGWSLSKVSNPNQAKVMAGQLSKDILTTDRLFANVRGYFKDGVVTSAEAQKMAGQLNKEDLNRMYNLNSPGFSKSNKRFLASKLSEYASKRTEEHFNYWTNPANNTKYGPLLRNSGISNMNELMKQARDAYGAVRQARKTNPAAKLGNREFVQLFRYIADQRGLPSDNAFDRGKMDQIRRELRRIADYI